MITILSNHENQWKQEQKISRLDDEHERYKYDNYEDLDEPEKQMYAPKKSKYSSGGWKKRSFGVPIWSEEGKTLDKNLKLTWGAAFRDKDVRDWMSVGWEQWVIDNNFCSHWRKKKNVNRSAGENGSENDKLGGDEIQEMELILEGDDDFESCRAGVWEEIHENED